MQAHGGLATTTAEDMRQRRTWTEHLLAGPEHLPISFIYDGQEVQGIPAGWRPTARRRSIDANIGEIIWEGTDPQSGLQVRMECQEYRDYPVVEWTAWLTNTAGQPTPLIQDLLALQATFVGASPMVYHCNGDFYSEQGYTPEEMPLHDGAIVAFAPNGGRPSDGAFPYYRVAFAECGLTLAVGWPGQWAASFMGTDGGVTITAGQERTRLRLLPGESIRTPRITLLSWMGDTVRAVNLWRRWYLDHVLPRPDGRPLPPLLAVAGTDEGEEFTTATEDNQTRYMDKWAGLGFDYDVWLIDAGWYPCHNDKHERTWMLTGTWEPDPERFPRGLKPVSEHAARHGADLWLWFEPERVARDSWLAMTHPTWLLSIQDTGDWASKNQLLDLGNPEARRWLTDHYCRLIQDNGVTIYRQDFNVPPLRYWRENDAEDRQGLLENLHVQGYLQFWDDLLARNPGLWIDSCASGGRRNDLETMRRSVPLHYSDYGYGNHPVKLAFQHTLYSWLPYFKDSMLSWDLDDARKANIPAEEVDSFAFHCAMAPMLLPAMNIRRDDYDFDVALRMITIWRRAAGLLLHGDYYPLTPFSRAGDRWMVRQFDRPDVGEGLVQGIRHAGCAQESVTVQLWGLDGAARYMLDNPETGERREISGAALLSDGLTFALPRRSGAIWFYTATGPTPGHDA